MTSIFVTHDQEEAFVLGDRVAVMRQGRVVQVGSPSEVYETPATPWVRAAATVVSQWSQVIPSTARRIGSWAVSFRSGCVVMTSTYTFNHT